MADRINFDKKINDSVQVVDELYWGVEMGDGTITLPTLLGPITVVGDKYVVVDDAGNASYSDFFMFRKPAHNNYTNTSSLKGYHAEVEFTNDSASKQELFAVGSEVTISSK